MSDSRLAGRRELAGHELYGDLPDDAVMLCPGCPYEQEVSPEDPDASQSELIDHFRRRHAGEEWELLLRCTKVVVPSA